MNLKKSILSILCLFIIIVLFTSWQVAAEKPNYYIDISLFPEGYAKFKIYVDNYGNLGDVVIELPTSKCKDNFTNISDLRRTLKVTDIPDMQTYEGAIDLKQNEQNCMGVGITRPHGISRNSTISFTYQNFSWKSRPDNYPFDSYNMPILVSFPVISSEDSISVSIRILIPPNMVVKNPPSAYLIFEHPANTRYEFIPIGSSLDNQGNQQIILLETLTFHKNNPAPAIDIPLEFKRSDPPLQSALVILIFSLTVILTLFATLIYKNVSTDLGILTIVALLFSFYQFLIRDKPSGVTTCVDIWFLTFLVLSLLLFIFHMFNKLVCLRTIIIKLWKKTE